MNYKFAVLAEVENIQGSVAQAIGFRAVKLYSITSWLRRCWGTGYLHVLGECIWFMWMLTPWTVGSTFFRNVGIKILWFQ